MAELNSRERIIRTIEGKEVDRLAIYDIIHNVDFIEHITGQKVTSANAEDLVCKAVSETLDLVRHFCIPSDLETKTYTDEDGFVFRQQWWMRELVKRPVSTVDDTRELMKKDIDRIYKAIDKGAVCWQALEHLELLGEHCETLEEVNELFARLADKLNPTMMIAPESLPGMYNATNRYGFEPLLYTYYDYPEDFMAIYTALCDYEISRIQAFGEGGMIKYTPVALLSEAVAQNTGLLFSPEFVKEIQYPNIKRVIDEWKKYDFKVIFHADGNKWEILADIIAMGADVIDPFETLATMEVKKFRELYPDTTIASPVDCQDLLAHGTKEEIAAACWKVIDDCGGKRVLLGSTSEIHPEISVENAMTMYEIFKNYNDPAFVAANRKN